jgi:APA family basic amino acid/polyamine antiporter
MSRSADPLPRVLGLPHTVVIVIGAVIGVGIFFTPSQVARLSGSADNALWMWALGGVLAVTGGVTFGELGRRFPQAGGQYCVIAQAWGPFAGFVYVSCLLTAIQAGAAAIIARIAAQNLVTALGIGEAAWLAPALIGAVMLTNMAGVRQGVGVQFGTVAAKLAVLAGIVCAAVVAAPPAVVSSAAPTVTGLAVFAGVLPAMFSYGGWQHALWMAGEVRDPERTLPRGIAIGVAVVLVTYLSAAWAYFALLGYDGVVSSKALAADAVAVVLPGTGARLVAGAVAVSAFGVLNAQFLAGPRQVWAIARDGLFPSVLGWLHPTRTTPVVAILALGASALTVLFAAGDIGSLIAWTVVIDTLFFALAAAALLRFQAGRFDWTSLAAALFILLEGVALTGAISQPEVRGAALTGVVWVAAVAGVYAVRRVFTQG